VTGIPAVRTASPLRGQPRLAEAEFRSYIRTALIINITICVFARGKFEPDEATPGSPSYPPDSPIGPVIGKIGPLFVSIGKHLVSI
jgi:hypothetical protein